jgi:hypothetical protein
MSKISESLFDYENRVFREEVLYLLRQLADYQGIIPFADKDRRRHVDPDWDGWVSEDPHSALEAVLAEDADPVETPVKERSRSNRYAWSKLDTRCGELTDLRTYWFNRAATTKDKKAADRAREEYVKVRRQYGRRANALYRLLAQGKIEVVDGVLYERGGDEPNSVWIAGDFVTK